MLADSLAAYHSGCRVPSPEGCIGGGIALHSEQVEFTGTSHRLGAIGRSEFRQDMFDMEFHRLGADHQLLRDLLV